MARKGLIGGILYWIILGWLGTTGVLTFLVPLLPLLLINKRVFRLLVDQFVGAYIAFVIAILEVGYGTRFVVTGDPIISDETSIMILNHRTRLDWMFFWGCLYRHGYANILQQRITLKAFPLKHIPGLGWACQFAAFLFLQRKLDQDQKLITTMLNFFKSLHSELHLVLFPEGTDRDAGGIESSANFAEKNNLVKYDYVLHPRTTGFSHCYRQLKQVNDLKKLYDVTVAYPDIIPQGEKDIALGNFPSEVHFHVKSYTPNELPSSDEELQEFCRDRWKEKEAALKTFYEGETRSFGSQPYSPCFSQKLFLYYSLMFWLCYSIIVVYFLFSNWYLLRYLICTGTAMMIVPLMFDGVDQIQVYIWSFVSFS